MDELKLTDSFKLAVNKNLPKVYLLNIFTFFWFKRVLDQGSEQKESKLTVLCPLIIIILIS